MNKNLFLMPMAALLLLWYCKQSTTEENTPLPSLSSEAVQLADQQLEGYNNRDMEAFLLPYSDSVKVYYNLKELGYQGKDKMRENYEGMFSGLSHLHCELVNRIVFENTVIDHERVSFQRENGQGGSMEAIAIYKIKHGKIQEVYFTSP